MAQLLAAPYSYFADSNGEPLAGGLIYTYQAGTTTPKTAYTDSTASVPLTNPVVLDSAGRATIWLNGSYKIVVQDSLGATISTTDNIASVSATGDMLASVYDPANIQQQLVGISAVQTLTNKTITSPVINGTITGTAVYTLNSFSNSLASNVALNNTTAYFDTVTVSQGTSGKWFASASLTVEDTGSAATLIAKLWDGTTVMDSIILDVAAGKRMPISLSGIITSPVANIKVSVQDSSATTGVVIANQSGLTHDSTLTVFRIG